MPRTSRSVSAIALVVALLLLLVAVPSSALGAGAVVFRDHGNSSGEADEPNICGWPAHFDGHITYELTTVDAGGNYHVTFHLTDNWTVLIADDPSVPASVRGETWRGRNEITYILNVDPSTQRIVEVTVNPFSEGPFRGLVDRITLVVNPDGTARVDRHEINGSIDCSGFD